MVLVDRFELALRLHNNVRGNLAGANHADEVLEVGNLLVGELVQETGDVSFQRAAVLQCLVAQDVEHLRVDHGRDEVKRHIRIGHNAEQRRFPVPNLVQFQVVPLHKLANLLNVKGGHPCAAANKYRFSCFACCLLSRTFLSCLQKINTLQVATNKDCYKEESAYSFPKSKHSLGTLMDADIVCQYNNPSFLLKFHQ